MKLSLCLLACGLAFGQAVTPPTPQTITSTYLNLNKMHYATGGWQSTVVYNSQDLVNYLGISYISLVRGNLNHSPLAGLPWWDTLAGGSGGGGGGAVSSIFGRIGGVLAQAGDYNASQVTNAVSTLGTYSNPTWITGLDYGKLQNTPTFFYQALQFGGTPQQQRSFLNFSPQFAMTDVPASNRTSLDLANTITSSTSGNAATATAFATTPTQCNANQFSMGITATGAAQCGFITYSQISSTPILRYQNAGVNSLTQTQHGRINFIQGTNVTLTPTDNGVTDSTDVTISATAGAGGYTTLSSNGTSLTARSQANFSTEFTAVDNAGAGRTDVSLNQIAATKVTGLAPSALTDATNANNITSGQLALARGGVVSNLSATGGAHNVLQQPSVGQAITVGQLAAGDISGLATSATTDTTSANNITGGTLAALRLPQFLGGQVTTAGIGSTNLVIGAAQVTNAMLAGSIDATSKFTGITPPANGGTGNAFTGFSGPTGSLKTFTVPNQSANLITSVDTQTVTNAMLAANSVTPSLVPVASLQGTDTKFLSSGTASGTGNPLCLDALGGATTSGCNAGAGTVTTTGTVTATALVTANASTVIQTPSATATMDSSGNISTPGKISAGVGQTIASSAAFVQGTDTAAPANSVGYEAPPAVTTAYRIQFPGAPAAGFVRRTNATPSVESVAVLAGADLPNPGAASLGGVDSKDCSASSGFLQKINTDGTITCATPAGAGTVTSSGPPSANQVAYFTTGTNVAGTATDTTVTHVLHATAGVPAMSAIVAADISTALTTSNANTATALAANGANCAAGQVAAGVDQFGVAEGCTSIINGTQIPNTVTLMSTVTGVTAGQEPAFTGDVTKASGSIATTVTAINGTAVPASAAILGTNGSAQPVALSVLPTSAMPALAGDVANTAGTLATTIQPAAVINSKLANMANNTLKGNQSGSAGPPLDLTASQVTAMLGLGGNLVACAGVDDSAAIATAAAASGTTQVFPYNGTCVINGPAAAWTGSNITWQLNGTTIKHKAGDTTHYMLDFTGMSNFRIFNGTIDYNNVLQTTAQFFPVHFNASTGVVLEDVTFLNSGADQPRMGGLYLQATSGVFNRLQFQNTITGHQLYSTANPAGSTLQISNSTFDGSKHNALMVWAGAASSDAIISNNSIKNVTAVDDSSNACISNTGECGNGISIFQPNGQITISHNHIVSTTFSGIRNNASGGGAAQVLIEGNEIDKSQETALYVWECPGCAANSIAGSARAIGNKISNSAAGMGDTNVATRAGATTQVSETTLMLGNKLSDIRGVAIHSENAIVTGNTVTRAAKGLEYGYGATGFGNSAEGNTFVSVGVAVAASKDLTATNNRISTRTVQTAAALGTNGVVPMANDTFLTITAATNANPLLLTYTGTDPTNTQVYLLSLFSGMTQANGTLCTVAAVNTVAKTFQCSGVNSTAFGVFSADAASDISALAHQVYSSGTTLAFSLPAGWVDTTPAVGNITGLGTNVATFLATTLPTAAATFLATPSGANFNSMIQAGGVPVAQNSQSAAYTTVLADGGKQIYHPTADNNARTFTIDSNANVAYPVGTTITFINEINTLSIAITTDTMVLGGGATTGTRTCAAGCVATAIKVGATRWYISGPGLT